ncbi:putative aldehyde dehydrogenase [Pseudomonas aeruginosa]|nr:putative aldehyde dehydrogenase [Pseudomonas aeruginosa]
MISFTGSSATGRAISAAGARHLKRFGLELGGKTPHLVFDDADLDAALPVLEKSLTVFAGQFCMTGSRLLVQRGVAERLRERLAQRLENLRVGPAADPRSDMGPLIDKANVERVERAVRQAIAAGARVVVRGGPVTEGELAAGAFYRPTLLEVDDPDLDIVQQETFGPVLTLQVFEHEEEGVALANRSEYGLAAGVWTRDVARAFRVARKIRAGTVWINDWAKVYDRIRGGRLPPVRPRPAERGRRPGRLRRIQAHQPDHRRGLSLGERCGRRRRPLLPGAGIHVFAEQLGQSGNLLETQHLVIVHAQFAATSASLQPALSRVTTIAVIGNTPCTPRARLWRMVAAMRSLSPSRPARIAAIGR